MKDFLKRFIKYQSERFPFLIIIFTTAAVIFSSFTIAVGEFNFGKTTVVAFITSLLFMFHIRLFDELKDFEHDLKYYPDRPVSRGLMSVNEIRNLSMCVIAIEILINVFDPIGILLLFIVALCYSLIARKEFFVRKWLREHFFTYNLAHYVQISLLLIYFYSLAGATLWPPSRLLIFHFFFTNFTLILLEWARKMRPSFEENESRDTYSARLGIVGVSFAFAAIGATTFLLFYAIKVTSGSAAFFMIYAWIALALLVATILVYAIKKTKASSNILQLSSLIFFVLLHFLV
jgi:4-hydroxybenzoate polyprenyltransferase